MPDVAIVDYIFTMTSPRSVTDAPGLDALTHAVEGYTSKKAQPLTDTFAISAIKRIFKYLPIAYKDGKNEESRKQYYCGSTIDHYRNRTSGCYGDHG